LRVAPSPRLEGHRAIYRDLLQALARPNNHLTRLISQSRIRGGRQDRKQAEELQRALATEDCRPA
jgi:hypothetical protein